jgi:hypothetical protein
MNVNTTYAVRERNLNYAIAFAGSDSLRFGLCLDRFVSGSGHGASEVSQGIL